MPNVLKNLLLFVIRLAIVVFVWVLLSTYYPLLSFEKTVITEIPVTATPTLEPLIIPTLKPKATLVPEQSIEISPTITASPVISSVSRVVEPPEKALEIIVDDTQKGILLTVTGGKGNYNYRLGPLAKGAYALGPNQNFLVYVTDDGVVYISRLGETRFQKVEDIGRSLSAVNKHVDPTFELSFHDTGYVYILFVYEGRFGETVQVILPRLITHF